MGTHAFDWKSTWIIWRAEQPLPFSLLSVLLELQAQQRELGERQAIVPETVAALHPIIQPRDVVIEDGEDALGGHVLAELGLADPPAVADVEAAKALAKG